MTLLKYLNTMDLLAHEFKNKSIKIIDASLSKLQEYKGQLPFNLGLIQMGKNMFILPMEGDSLINMFIEDSSHSWDAIKAKNEDEIIKTLNSEVKDKAPLLQSIISDTINFLLKNRRDLFDVEFEDYLWNEVGDLVKIAIKFAHIKRCPKLNPEGVMKYTCGYAPSLSIKKHSATWGVCLD